MDDTKSGTQTFRCPPDLVEFIKTEAKRENRSLSQQVRHLLEEAARGTQKDHSHLVFMEHDLKQVKEALSDIQSRLTRLEKLAKAKPSSHKSRVKR